jgi:GMP synthase (glutamine-hydrolysing)
MNHILGGKVEKAPVREYGKTEVFVDKTSPLFADVSESTICWMSHFDYISQAAPGFRIVAHTADCPVAAAEDDAKKLYAIQFHPEVLHTQEGTKMLYNFVRNICGCVGSWRMDSFVEHAIREIQEKVGNGKVLLALSGGVDSSVAAGLLSRAIGKQLTCVFVDHGLLRKNEGDEVENVFGSNGQFDLNFIRVNAQERYYKKLSGVTEPEQKRKIIGEEFIRVFEEEAKKIGAVDFLAQGTIYPDVVESGLGGESAVIKSHHNVGGLPDYVDFKEIIEPLRDLFKDEVRKAGLELGIPEELVFRQPFPGPGLGIRIIGEVTADKVRIVQDADAIYREEVDRAAYAYKKENGTQPSWMPNQYFAALTNMRSVGVMGDERTYDYAVALRAVKTIDFMTAESAEIPFEVLQTVMSRIINEVKGVNRVMYDLTSKPPGTIEFE